MAPILKTYTNKNVSYNKSVDAFDALFAQNILKRKQTNALKKRKNVYTIKDLPPAPRNRTLLNDSSPLCVNINSTFDRLLKEGNINTITPRVTRSQSRNSSLTKDGSQQQAQNTQSPIRNSLKTNDVSLEIEYVNLKKKSVYYDSLHEIPSICGLVSSTPYKLPKNPPPVHNDTLPSFITKIDQKLLNESLQQIKEWSQKPPDFKTPVNRKRGRPSGKLNNPKIASNKRNYGPKKKEQKELFVKITKLSESLVNKKLNKSLLLKAKDFNRLFDSCGANVSEAITAGDVSEISIKSVSLADFENFALSVSENLISCADVSEVVVLDDPVTNDSVKNKNCGDQFVNKRTRKNGGRSGNQSKKAKLNLSDSVAITRSRAKADKSVESEISMVYTLATQDTKRRSRNTSTKSDSSLVPYVTKRNKQYNKNNSASVLETTNKNITSFDSSRKSCKYNLRSRSIESSIEDKRNEVSTSPKSFVLNDMSLTPYKPIKSKVKKNSKSLANIKNIRRSENVKRTEVSQSKAALNNNNVLNQLTEITNLRMGINDSSTPAINKRLTEIDRSTNKNNANDFINTNRRKFTNMNEMTSTILDDTDDDKSKININLHFVNNMKGQSFKKTDVEIYEIGDSSGEEMEEEEKVFPKKIIVDFAEVQRNALDNPFTGFPREHNYSRCSNLSISYVDRLKSPQIEDVSAGVRTTRKTKGSKSLSNTCDESIERSEVITTHTDFNSKNSELSMRRSRSKHNDRKSIKDNSVTGINIIDLTSAKKVLRSSREHPVDDNQVAITVKRGSGQTRYNESIDLTDETVKKGPKRTLISDIENVTTKVDIDADEKDVQLINSINVSGVRRNSLEDKSDIILIEDSFVKPLPRHFIKAGKMWRRSLSIYKKNSFISKMTINMPEPTCKIEEDLLGWQKGRQTLAELTVCRNSIRLIPDPTPKKRSKRLSLIGSYANRTSYVPNNIQGALEQILEGLSVSGTDETQHLSIEDNGNETNAPFVTARDIVLRRCGQTEPIPFLECYPPLVLKNCHKIGEGVYGEVFLFRNKMGTTSVMKVIPIEGDLIVNGERQKKFEEILTEIIIAMELSDLRKNKKNSTSGFNEVSSIHCVKGQYPERLLDLWDLYNEDRGSENDCPDVFGPDQLYIVLELCNGGKDLESYIFNNAMQSYSLFQQAACSLAVAEVALQFEHRDLHWGNILISGTDRNKKLMYNLSGRQIEVPSNGVQISIIDFTLSRITFDGICIYNDLGQDPDLFNAEGDYQFEIYRLMQKCNQNEWQHYEPYTNILWLHYTLDKMITALRYKYPETKCHKVYLEKLKELKGQILEFKSVEEFVTQTFV